MFRLPILASRRPDRLALSAWRIARGIGQARRILHGSGAALVVGFGGYPAFPALAAARTLSLPLVIHEQNAVLGRVNRRFAGVAKSVASGFARLDKLPEQARARHQVVGNPIRQPILDRCDDGFAPIETDGPLNLLVTGGSQGARLFGEVIPQAVAGLDASLRARLTVVQQVRAEQMDEVRAVYAEAGVSCELAPFFSDMPERLHAAHLVIARAGASSVTELAAMGRPAILVPLAIAMDDHQTANAEAIANAGAADIVFERQFMPDVLTQLLAARLGDPQDLAKRGAAVRNLAVLDAGKRLADLAVAAVGATGPDDSLPPRA